MLSGVTDELDAAHELEAALAPYRRHAQPGSGAEDQP
jgi:hypothetical protein